MNDPLTFPLADTPRRVEPVSDPRQQYNEERLAEWREHQKRRKSVKKTEFKKILRKEVRDEVDSLS